MLNLFFNYLLLFFIYSILGWIVETTFLAITEKKWVDRGFLIGPYCPIYGVGAILIVLYLTQYKNNFITVFILGVVVSSILEYFTSYIMEKLFKTRWWDYSNEKFNLNGRICGLNSLLFGLCSIGVIYFIQPILSLFIKILNTNLLVIITIIFLMIFITDIIISCNVANKFKKTVLNLELKKDSTQEFTKLVRETIKNNHKILQKRLFMAFPNIDLKRLRSLKSEIKEEIKEFLNK